ncbi:MAG: hypothetical protein DCF31_08170 [Alphaproteobacteria bacterium]|nr:MAG: hypothetical protein DCF31_08170 [Alphaproteobacteria bacterium]
MDSWEPPENRSNLARITADAVRGYGDAKLIRNNQNRRRRGGNGPRPQQMGGGNNYGNRLDNRQRGNASQLLEKYRALARDAQQAGDRVTAEYYLQYADHYYRVLGDYRDKQPETGRQRGREFYDDDNTAYAGNDDADIGDDEDQDGDRSEARGDDRDDQQDNRGNWREERGNQGNQPRERQDRNDRDRNDRTARDGNRDRQSWNGNAPNRSRDGNAERGAERAQQDRAPDRAPDRERQADRPNDRSERRERPERRPEAPSAAEPAPVDEGPIPGLPGPATLRVTRPVDGERAERPARAPRREPVAVEAEAPAAVQADAPGDESEVAAPRRRGRPRKVVAELPIDG